MTHCECWFADICQENDDTKYCRFEAVILGAQPCAECPAIPECPDDR